MRRRLTWCAAVALVSVPLTAPAQAVTVGAANQANAAPFGYLAGATRYQQIYAASAFAGPLTIGSLSFFHTRYIDGDYLPGTFVVRLGTTQQTVAGLGLDFAANATSPLQSFATVTFGGSPELATTTIVGTPFVYDPHAGNLLLDILYAEPLLGAGVPAQFDADGTGTVTRRVYGTTGGFGYDNIALVTRFDAVMTAPEPGTWALLCVGLVGTVAARRRRGQTA